MTAYLLFYETPTPSGLSDRQWIDKWCGVYGVYPIIIDLKGRAPRVLDKPPYMFRSLKDAVEHSDFTNCKWIWLDHRAEYRWDQITLPKKDVVYCIGSDISGFQGQEFPGTRIKVASPNKQMQDEEWYASMVATMLLFEVFVR